jgi:hypothetical protein
VTVLLDERDGGFFARVEDEGVGLPTFENAATHSRPAPACGRCAIAPTKGEAYASDQARPYSNDGPGSSMCRNTMAGGANAISDPNAMPRIAGSLATCANLAIGSTSIASMSVARGPWLKTASSMASHAPCYRVLA